MKGEVSKPQAVEKAVFMYVTRTTCQCSLLSVHGGHRTLDPLLKFFNDISTNVSSPEFHNFSYLSGSLSGLFHNEDVLESAVKAFWTLVTRPTPLTTGCRVLAM